MSKIRKRPHVYLNQGTVAQRNVKAARTIKSQAQLDVILSQADTPAIAEGWLKEYGKHLPFVPRQFKEIQVGIQTESAGAD